MKILRWFLSLFKSKKKQTGLIVQTKEEVELKARFSNPYQPDFSKPINVKDLEKRVKKIHSKLPKQELAVLKDEAKIIKELNIVESKKDEATVNTGGFWGRIDAIEQKPLELKPIEVNSDRELEIYKAKQQGLIKHTPGTGGLATKRGVQEMFLTRTLTISDELKVEIQTDLDLYNKENANYGITHSNPDTIMKRDAIQKMREFNEEFKSNSDIALVSDDYIPVPVKKKKKKQDKVIKI